MEVRRKLVFKGDQNQEGHVIRLVGWLERCCRKSF